MTRPSITPLIFPEHVIDRNLHTVTCDTPVNAVIGLMSQHRADYVLILEEQKLVGIFTERDVTRLVAAELNLEQQPIARFMSRQVVTISLNALQTNIWSVLSILRQYHIRHLPVLDAQEHVLGVITPHSLRTSLTPVDLLRLRQVTEVMTREVITTTAETSLLQITRMMTAHRVSSVVITRPSDTGQTVPVGIVTEQDIVRLQAAGVELAQATAQTHMSHPLQVARMHDSLWAVHEQMQHQQIRRVVVVDQRQQLVGIVTQSSVLQAIDLLELSNMVVALQQVVGRYSSQVEAMNEQLHAEVEQCKATEGALRQTNADLENTLEDYTQNLRLSEQRYRSLVENSPDKIGRFDRQLRHVYVNPAAERITGLPASAFLGKTHAEVDGLPASVATTCQAALRQVFEQKQEVTIEVAIPTPEGIKYFHSRFVPEFDAAGNVETALAISRDITTLKQAEADIQRVLGQEQALNGLKSQFITTVSHEFRTPLTVITTATELLQNYRDRYTDQQIQARLGSIHESTQYIKNLLNDLVTISSLMDGDYALNLVEVNLISFCQTLLAKHAAIAQANHTLQFSPPAIAAEAPLFRLTDPNVLQIVLDNLLSNAIKFSPQGGQILLELTPTPDTLTFRIHDEGVGIPESDLPHLFQPFNRATTAGTLRGNGIGLSIVKQCMDLFGGNVSIESQVAVGTIVTVRLPAIAPTGD